MSREHVDPDAEGGHGGQQRAGQRPTAREVPAVERLPPRCAGAATSGSTTKVQPKPSSQARKESALSPNSIALPTSSTTRPARCREGSSERAVGRQEGPTGRGPPFGAGAVASPDRGRLCRPSPPRATPESGAGADFDGHKRRKGGRVHAAVAPLGNRLVPVVTPAAAPGGARAAALAAAAQAAAGNAVEPAWVDLGEAAAQAEAAAIGPGISRHVVDLSEAQRGVVLLPRRWVVERSAAWAARFRRLARDDERLSQTDAGLRFVAFAWPVLRRLVSVVATGPRPSLALGRWQVPGITTGETPVQPETGGAALHATPERVEQRLCLPGAELSPIPPAPA